MKKILYLASFDIGKRTGGGLASLCYYNALCEIRPGMVDLMMNDDCCKGKYADAIKIPARHGLEYITDFSLHRGRKFIINYVRCHAHEYDICVINCSRYGGDMMHEIKAFGLKIVMIHHNYEVEFCMDNKYNITLYGHIPHYVAHIERTAYKLADVNCYLTDCDKTLIKRAYGESDGKDYMLGVFDYQSQTYSPSECIEDNTMIFSGAMNDYQTYHSIELFESEYYDIIKTKFPFIKLIITGRNPNSAIWTFQERNQEVVEVVSNPENIEEVINRGKFFFCPTCIGSGIKLRLMDGLKKGLPVLVHCVSARGYEMFMQHPFFQVYNDRESFEAGLDNIIKYISTTPNYQAEVLKIYKEYFSFESGVKRMRDIIDLIAK